MTDINPKALEHACQCAGRSVHHFDRMALDLPLRVSIVAHARAIEQHEAFKLEVSDEAEKILNCTNVNKRYGVCLALNRFIIAKPDNIAAGLALAVEDTLELVVGDEDVNRLRAALAARGLEIREVGHD